nr:zinc finger, CCHC-type [Tanacetum cinerariifolium]
MNYQQPPQFSNTWPMQDSFVVPRQDAPPPLEPRKPERPRPSKQTRYLYSGQNNESFNQQHQMQQFQQQQMQQFQHQHRQQHHQKHYSPGAQTYYEEKSETTNEIVFGAVQEQDGKHGAVVIKAVDYSNYPNYGNQNIRSRYNYMGYAYEPKENTQVDDKKDKATTAFLYQALTEDVILQVEGCKTAKELWESLKKRHVGEEKVQQARLQSLMIGFQTLQMKEDDTMDAFTAKLNDRFIQIVASIEQTNDLDDITLDEIVGKLKAFEERIKLRKGGQVESQESLLFAHGEHSGKGRRFSRRGGKHSRTPFLNQAKFKSKNPLNLVYGDLCGPISPATHSGKKLIFLLVDDCTRFMWAYFLTSKDQAFSTFKEFRQQIEMEMRMKFRMLRTDRGGEFTSNEFTKYCKENGIV